ncbi:hypothetical protein XYCOK13_28430 [Xylanibacillus composti]|uniref:SLH domain-containing protein n=1 Tax=Xylanibacillus composti TaxID=1572762 RepID=A0A8J4H367_9BACL|nr:S-layer homology domain-containing protein [Xylanibacillus composti]GIQ70019.1 hypothetical protein XYCOK13_28430 [Xylanibacillus composti]
MSALRRKLFLFMLVVAVIGTAAMPVSLAKSFDDVEGHWAQAPIETWNQQGVVVGDERGFRPNDPVTRAEFAVMLNNIMKYTQTGSNPFADIVSGQWYYEPILKLHAAGVMNGYDGQAMPQQKITRQEAAVMVAKALDAKAESEALSFKDAEEIADWAVNEVRALMSLNWLSGMPDQTFRPAESLTRAQAVALFDQAIQSLIQHAGTYQHDVAGNVVINAADVTLKSMKISGDLYIAQGVGEGDVILEDVEIEGSVHVYGGGINSILFNNVQVHGALIVNKYNGQVRILATGNTSVSLTVLESGAMLVTRELVGGGFEVVEISEEVVAGHQIVLDGVFNRVINRSESASITANGTIKELVAEVDTNINGEAVIESITAGDGTNVTVDGRPAGNGNAGSPGSGGGGGSGGNRQVAVTGVSIDQEQVSLVVGQTYQLTASIQPANATNRQVAWSVVDGSDDVISISSDGLVTAVGPGAKDVRVTTQDGGRTDQITVLVTKPVLGFALEPYTADIADSEVADNAAILANSSNVQTTSVTASVYQAAVHHAMAIGQAGMQVTGDAGERYLKLVIHVLDQEGQPLADSTGIQATVTGSAYAHAAAFGHGLSSHPSSLVLTMDAGNPEAIQHYQLVLKHDHFTTTTLDLQFIPAGTAWLSGMKEITGSATVGSELTAGTLSYEGTPVNGNVRYQWLRGDQAEGLYERIEGAHLPVYETTADDGGKYIKVIASADQLQVGGFAVSPPFGPIALPVDPDEVFAAIEELFLKANSNRNNIISDLNLVTALDDFPGVEITWTSDNEAAITSDGIVVRDPQNDQFVTLTATLSGLASGTKTYSLIVRAEGTDNVELEGFIDPYFADNYPQAYMKDGTIWVRFQLDQPAEVFMIVNSYNGRWEASVKAVLEGRAGVDQVIYADRWPYFKVDDPGQIFDFNTWVPLYDHDARVEFVIVDRNNDYTSEKVTSIVFDKELVEALDTKAPEKRGFYINAARDELYLYFHEHLDLGSVPAPGDFALNYGTVNGVSLYNYEGQTANYADSYVKLAVSGIAANEVENLTVTYTGNALQDTADARNKVEKFEAEHVIAGEGEILNTIISSDRKHVLLEIEPGWNPYDNSGFNAADVARFTVQTEGGSIRVPDRSTYRYTYDTLWYELKFNEALPAGDVAVTMDASGIVGWAKDHYPSQLQSDEVTVLPAPGAPSAVYSVWDKTLLLTFAEGFRGYFSSFLVAGLAVEVDGIEYALRGFSAYMEEDTNVLRVHFHSEYDEHIREAMETGVQVRVKYTKVNGEDPLQFTDAAGALIPDFDYVPVTVQP